ncbi:alpha/beta hydrolase [Actinocorallia sp. API 0066]|uniref:alpha/beta hydrolase n=1 Tax=Actinocorallia sp. API 0066 TaxID=2896846 RepID=UPI0027DF40C5|nr:alpha/beta hydrolase [Actinocorallia sp. API 0066]
MELPDLRRRRDLLKAAADPTRQEWIKASNALMKTLMGENHSLYTSLINSGLHPMDIPVHDPQAAATWWSHLTPRQQSLYTRAFPSTIGWTDGLPTPARDKANRQTLTTRLTHLESLPPTHQTPFETRDLTRLRQLVGQIERLEGGGLKVRLIGFDSTVPGEWDSFGGGGLKFGLRLSAISDGLDGPDGRLILSIGDPDSADNVAVYVPGTTAQIDSIRGDLDRAANLWRRSVKYGSGSVATIVWLGYDAPDTILKDAPVDKYAEAGAPKLLRFIDGLPAGSSKHVTAIGHSYGSVVIGEAAIRGDLKVDEVIAVGSPGMHVGEAKDLDVKPENVWVMAATGDPVPQIGRFTHGGAAINGVSVVPQVPSDEGFGANILATDTRGHSAYWAEESQSLDNQAKVIMGGHFTPEQSDDPVLAERPRLYR